MVYTEIEEYDDDIIEDEEYDIDSTISNKRLSILDASELLGNDIEKIIYYGD